MIETPLQLSDALDPNQFEALVLTIHLVKVVIGLFIAYVAYRGYRRNASRPMLFLSLGFILVLGAPFALYLLAIPIVALLDVPSILQSAVVVLAELSQVLGLLVIVYAIRI